MTQTNPQLFYESWSRKHTNPPERSEHLYLIFLGPGKVELFGAKVCENLPAIALFGMNVMPPWRLASDRAIPHPAGVSLNGCDWFFQ